MRGPIFAARTFSREEPRSASDLGAYKSCISGAAAWPSRSSLHIRAWVSLQRLHVVFCVCVVLFQLFYVVFLTSLRSLLSPPGTLPPSPLRNFAERTLPPERAEATREGCSPRRCWGREVFYSFAVSSSSPSSSQRIPIL